MLVWRESVYNLEECGHTFEYHAYNNPDSDKYTFYHVNEIVKVASKWFFLRDSPLRFDMMH